VLLTPLAGRLGVLLIGVTLAALVTAKQVIYRNDRRAASTT